jgi:hypothetical protein
MKKMKLLGALALASCVVLGGCNKPTEPSANPSIVVEGVPVEALIGDVFDFDSYVKVQDSSESFSIELSEGGDKVAKVEGHKVTFIGEGTVTITAKLGELSGSAQVSVVAPLRKEFAEWSKDIGDGYSLFRYSYVESEEEEGAYDILIGGFLTHGSKYSFDEEFDVVDITEEGEYVYAPGGYVEAGDGLVYTYTVDEDSELHFEVRGNEPADISAVAGPFSVDLSKLKYEPASEGYSEDLFYPASKASEAAMKSMFQINFPYEDYGYSYSGTYIEDFDLVSVDEETGAEEEIQAFSFIPMIKYGKQEYILDMFIMFKDPEHGVDILDEYVGSEKTPEGLPFDSFSSALESVADIESGFKLSVDYGLCYEDGTKLSAEEIAALYEGDDPILVEGTLGGVLGEASGTVNAYVSSDWVHVEEVGLEHLSFGYKVNESKVYKYAYDAESTHFKAAEIEDAEGLSDLDPEQNFSFFDHETLIVDSEGNAYGIYDNIFVNQAGSFPVSEDTISYICEFCGESGFDLLSYLLFYSVPESGEDDRWVVQDVFYYVLYYYDFIWDMEVYVSYDVKGEAVVGAEISSFLDIGLEDADGNALYWEFDVTFGAYAAPEGVVIDYPVAA